MDFDEMLEEIGEFGQFQLTNYALICLPVLFAAANSLSYVFTAGEPNYRCYISECEDLALTEYNQPWVGWAIPPDETRQKSFSLCSRYTINKTNVNSLYCSKEMFTSQVESCKDWIFDSKERTIVNDWNLTCEGNLWKLSFVGTTHFAGIVIGSALFGILADRYGRKNIFIFCIILMSISGIIQVFSPEYVSFVVFVFINALGTSGVYPLAFIIGVEMVGKRKREVTGIVLNYFYAVGEAMVGLIAWFTKDWISLQLIVSAPSIIFISYYWIIPESVRWLLSHHKNEKARGIVCRAARVNKIIMSESLMDSLKEGCPMNVNAIENLNDVKMLPIIKSMLKSKKLIMRFVIVYFIWAVNAFVYYGLSLNSTSIGGNKYINFSLVCLIEIPGYTLALICIKKIGRRISLVASLLLSGLMCLLTIFIPDELTWAAVLLFLIGKLGITSSFGIVYVHTAELLPTIIRSGGVGSASTVARLGALLAPFVPILAKPLSMIIFGTVAIAAGITAFRLPETVGKKLPETIDEAEML